MNHTDQKTSKGATALLFVCLGNICRSPAAEGIMRHLVQQQGLEHRFVIDSAGIGSWHVGQLPDHRMRACGHQHGYVFDSRARQFSAADFSRFDYIVVMDHDNRHEVLLQCPTPQDGQRVLMMADFLRHHPGQRTIPDPYYGGERGFHLVIELLEDACEGLLSHLNTVQP